MTQRKGEGENSAVVRTTETSRDEGLSQMVLDKLCVHPPESDALDEHQDQSLRQKKAKGIAPRVPLQVRDQLSSGRPAEHA